MEGLTLGPKLGRLEPVRSRMGGSTSSGSGLVGGCGLTLGLGVSLGLFCKVGTLLVDGTCELTGLRLNLLGSLLAPLPAVGRVIVTSWGGASVSASGSSYSYS